MPLATYSPYTREDPMIVIRLLPRKRRIVAFTLIELLTVIAIIGILAAIIVPTVSAVRKSAQAAQCLSNIRQIQLANILYATDNKGRYFYHRGEDASWWQSRIEVLQYMGGAHIIQGKSNMINGEISMAEKLKCPGMAEYRVNQGVDTWESKVHSGYSYNCTNATGASLSGTSGSGPSAPVYQQDIRRPSLSIAFIDGADYICNEGKSGDYAGVDKKINGATSYRHKGGANVVFWDGHSKFFPRAKLDRNVAAAKDYKPLWRFLSD